MPFTAHVLQRSDDRLTQVRHILRDEVGQIGILGVVPNHLHRVQVGGLGRQPFHLQPVGVRQRLLGLGTLIRPPEHFSTADGHHRHQALVQNLLHPEAVHQLELALRILQDGDIRYAAYP